MSKRITQQTANTLPTGLDLVKGGTRLTSLTFGIELYTNLAFSEFSEKLLLCYKKFLDICAPDRLRFYATTNMRKHQPVTKRTFGMLETWLKPGAPSREDIHLELKDGEVYQDAPKYKFAVSGGEKGSVSYHYKHANFLSVAFPPEWGFERTDEMLAVMQDLCSTFPAQSGHAGFAFECSRYEKKTSETYAWEKSMRHRGIDICRVPEDGSAVGQDALKGVGWLTFLGKSFIERLGGKTTIRKALDQKIEIIEVPRGLILKAGPIPAVGDVERGDHLPLYQSVQRLVSPLVAIAAERSMSFNIVQDYVRKKKAWFARFSDE
jgi:hypothetical protein